MNLPNKLSMLRICMIPFFVGFALQADTKFQIIAAVIFALASLTDTLDGQIARRRNLVTDFGKFIDPIADKLLTMSAFVVFVGDGRMASWMCIVIIGRELAISGFRLVAAGAGTVIAAAWSGKLKTVTQMAAILLLLLFPQWLGSTVVLYVALVMTILSGAEYLWKNRSCISNM
ncbi:MAG: CDP-diacylglycerol--glycerol-3-phosphate 3-phosphatidyltransferase [Clostridia bacterium]|nr:CDP-diacylglycerol--glycerol-3-phosphate 3-phosphatidyltransferase [Clostridia bacterium]